MSTGVPTTKLVLRERTVIEVLDLAVRFVSAHARIYARTALFVLVPLAVLTELTAAFFGEGKAWLLALTCGLLAQMPFTLLASRVVFEDRVLVGRLLSDSVSASGRIIGARLIQGALAFFAGLVGVLPALWPASALFFVPEVVLLEKSGPTAAASRANEIGSRQRGEVVLSVVLVTLLQVGVIVLAELAGRLFLVDVLQVNGAIEWSGHPFGRIGFWIFVPYLATARFLLYLDARTREEGWDVQMRFAALAARWRAERARAAGDEA